MHRVDTRTRWFALFAAGYAPAVRALRRRAWQRSQLYRMLTLNGYIAFNLPRAVAAAGSLLLAVLVGAHVYVLTTATARPAYLVVYCVALSAACLVAMAAIGFTSNIAVSQRGWQLGTLISAVLSRSIWLVGRSAWPGWWR